MKKGTKLPLNKGNRVGFRPIITPHPTCSIKECNKKIRFDNKIGVCREHRGLSSATKRRQGKYYSDNREKIRKQGNIYSEANREKKREYDKKRWAETKVKKRKYFRDYKRNREKTDILYKLIQRLRSRTRQAFFQDKKQKSTKQLLGAELIIVKQYIENKFVDGMFWDNHGKWHIDHIIPLSSGKTGSEIEKLCHYTNLQPLWAEDNLRKGSKIVNRP